MAWTEVADGADVNLWIGFLTPEAGPTAWGLGGGPVSGPLRSFAGLAPYIAEVPNSDEDWIYNLLLHEIGHALLIGHSDIPDTVVLPDGFGPGREDLTPDDIAAVQAIWGPHGNPPPDLTETGRLFQPTAADIGRGTAGDDIFDVEKIVGDDRFAGGFGADHITGGWGNDTLMVNGLYRTNWNNPAHDHWSRTYGGLDDGDTIFGDGRFVDSWFAIYGDYSGDPRYRGHGGTADEHINDFVNGNAGADLLYGGPGNDSMHGGLDEDLVHGEEGDDTLWGDLEGDTLDGGPGADHVILGNDAGAGDGHVDHVHFSSGEAAGDVVYGLEAHDVLWIDGAVATQDQVAALGVTFIPIVQVQEAREKQAC